MGNAINNTVLKPIHEKVIEPIDENIVKPAAKVINDAADYIGKAIDDTDEIIITPAEDIIDDAIDLIEQRCSEIPFNANLSANSSIKIDIIFNKGYLGAAEDLSTISLAITPQLEMNANAGIELDPLILDYSGTLDGPYYPILILL